MPKENDGGPAFPRPMGSGNLHYNESQEGMSLRDYFAIKALPMVWDASFKAAQYGMDGAKRKQMCDAAYAWADDMLESREK